MADKVKSQKDKYLDLLEQAYSTAGSKTGVNLSTDEIDSLFTDLTNTDASKVPQWLAANKDKLSMIPEVASIPEFISITENPKVVEKDYGFTESDDFYKMEGPKSWMNKSIAYLQNNADKYGLSLNEYLDKVRELSTSKEQERQWEENAKVASVNVPGIGEVNIPGLTAAVLPTSFNKAAMGQEVTGGDIAYDIATNELEAATATSPFKFTGPVQAALLGNAARQGKGLYDKTQESFSPGEMGFAAGIGALGVPVTTKAAGDLIKKGAGFIKSKPIERFAKSVEDIGNPSPNEILNNRVSEMESQIKKYKDLQDVKEAKDFINTAKLAKATGERTMADADPTLSSTGEALKKAGENILKSYEGYNPTAIETKLYGKGTKLWRNVQTGEILTDQQYKDAVNFMKEYNRGPDYKPTPKNVIENQYKRAVNIKNMPEGDILVNAWAEPKTMRMLRNAGKDVSALAGGRYGSITSEADKKEMAKNIINSTEWAKYVTGLPNNLTEEQIYIATVYGE